VRTPRAESLRFPASSRSAQGKSVPKPRPKGVGDGNPVKIPEPLIRAVGGHTRVGETGDGIPVERV
jgi:hypothetical protein